MGIPISNLPAATALTGTDLVAVVQNGTTKKATLSLVLSGTSGGGDFVTNSTFNSFSASITSSVSRLDSASGTFENELNLLTSSVVVLFNASSSFRSELNSQTASIVRIDAASASFRLELNSQTASIVRLDAASASFRTAIASQTASIVTLFDASASFRTAIASQTSSIVTLFGASSSFVSSIASQTASIVRLDSASGTFRAELTSLTSSVNTLLNFSQSINLSNSIPTKLEYDAFMGNAASGTVLFREEFSTDIDLWSTLVAGAGASVAILALNRRPTGHVRLNPGTTNTGSARLYSSINFWYSSYGGRLVWNTIATLPYPAPNPTDDYEVLVNVIGDRTNGMAFIAKSGSAPNYWKAIRYNSGISSSIDCTSFTASFNNIGQGADKRLTMEYDIDRATASFYIDNQFQARFTGSQIPSLSAVYLNPGWVFKITGTTSTNAVYLDYTEAVYYATSSWYRG